MRNETSYGNGFFQIIKGVIIALALSIIWSVVFANILRFTSVSDRVIYPVNQTVKVLAVCIGAFVSVRGEKGFVKGMAIGLLFSALSYLTFSALGGDFSLSWLIIVELLLSAFAGVICGALAVNLKKSA